MTTLLDGLDILELARAPAAAAAGAELARWGANVRSIEPDPGAPVRQAPPFAQGLSLLQVSLQRGKTIIPADPDRSPLDQLRDALDHTPDALITDLPRDQLDRLDLPNRFPTLVILHLSPFGSDGPYTDYLANDLIVQALAGFAHTNGDPERQPLAAPAAIVPRAVGHLAAVGLLAALLERRRSGRGQLIETTELEAASTLIMSLRSAFSDEPVPRSHGPQGWADVLPVQDGFVTLSPWSKETLRNAPIAFDVGPPPPDLLDAPGRIAPRQAARDYIRPIVADRPGADVFQRLSELGCVMGWHRTPTQLLHDPQLAALDFFQALDHSQLGPMTAAGPPARATTVPIDMHDTDTDADQSPHRDRFDRRAVPQPPHTTPPGPLHGLRVVDFTHAWLGPYASLLLADLGAEIIKIEGPDRPDLWRYDAAGPMTAAAPDAHHLNVRANFNMVNRGKRNAAIALDTEPGRDIALQLIARADLVLENFRPRVLQNLRLTHDHMRAANPRIALVSFSGFGPRGPWANFRTNGGATEANAGWDTLFGYRDEPPAVLGTMQADPIIGAQMAAAALAAVWRALDTDDPNHPQSIRVDGSMFESAVGYIDEHLLAASINLDPPQRDGNRLPADTAIAPHEYFPCKPAPDGADRWIAISILDDATWSRFANLADSSTLGRPQWRTASGRLADLDQLEHTLADWTRHWDARTLQTRLQAHRIPAAAVHSTLEHLADPHLHARNWWRYLTHPDTGVRQYQGSPWRFSRTPADCTLPAPRLGEHTLDILRDTLSYTDAQLQTLLHDRIIASLTDRAVPNDDPPAPISPR